MDQSNSSELDQERIEQIRGQLSELETDALLNEWKENDREEWTDEGFEAMRQILVSRLGEDLPPQADHEAGETQPDVEIIKKPPQTSIAGFWLRLFAFSIDGIVIAIPLLIIGFAFRDFAFSLGPWGRLIGFAIFILYWGYFSSEKRSGQTFGKQVFLIAVVDNDNHYLGVGKSFLRAFILGLIFLLNNWSLPVFQNPVIAILLAIIVFGGILSMIYGLVFNRTTRQGIHDLLVGSYVVKAPPDLEVQTPQIPRIHQRFTYSLLGVGLIIGIAGLLLQRSQPTLGILDPGEWEEMLKLQSSLMDKGEFFTVSVNRSNNSQVGEPAVLKNLNIAVWAKTSCSRNPGYCDELIKQVATTALKEYDNIENISGMQIAIVNRFDLGLATGELSQSSALSIEEWKKSIY